jgi:hypothetical protein
MEIDKTVFEKVAHGQILAPKFFLSIIQASQALELIVTTKDPNSSLEIDDSYSNTIMTQESSPL